MNRATWLLMLALSGAAPGTAGLAAAAAPADGPTADAGVSSAPYPVASGAGRIESLDFAANTVIVGGTRYRVAVDVRVEIGGSYGAYTMLTPGMRIRFDYLVVSPRERVMVVIQELPGDVKLDET